MFSGLLLPKFCNWEGHGKAKCRRVGGRRDRKLLRRLLLEIEALPSDRDRVASLQNGDSQDVLDHFDLLEQQKLIRATIHRVRQKVDLVAVHALTSAGHDWLEAEGRQEGHPPFVEGVSANGTAGQVSGDGAILREDGSPFLREDGTPLLREEADTEDHVGPSQQTLIIRAVLSNQIQAQISAVSLPSAIELKIEVTLDSGSNSEIIELHELKRRVEDFLAANAKREEMPIAEATLSIAGGLRRLWDEKHVSIGEKAIDLTIFGAGLAFCGVAGVLSIPTALTVGAIVGGKNVAEVPKAGAKLLGREGGEK